MLYLIPTILAGGLTLFFLWVFSGKCFATRFSTRSGARHGQKKYLRVGGLAIALGFFLALLFDHHLVIDQRTKIFFMGALLFLFFGAWDDVRELSWKVQLAGQVGIAVLLFLLGIHIDLITNPFGGVISFAVGPMMFVGLLVTIIWTVGIINALNWSDGINGLAGGISVIAGATLFILALRPEVNQPPLAMMALTMAGASLVFLAANLLTGRVILGTAGSSFLGYIIAVLAIFAGAKIGTALLIMVVPLMDALFVTWQRHKRGASIFSPDQHHFHHRLIERGWSHSSVLLTYWALTAGGAVLALTTQSVSKLLVFVLYAFLVFTAFIFLNTKQSAK